MIPTTHRLALSLALACTTAVPLAAQDASGFYAKVFTGLSVPGTDDLSLGITTSDTSFDPGPIFGGAVGFDYRDSPWRSELAFEYRSGDVSDLGAAIGREGDFASTTVMVNGYYRFEGPSALTPYVGAGLGYVTEIDFHIEGGAGAGEYSDRGGLGGQIMAGAEYALSDRLSVFGEGRYFSAGTVDLTGDDGTELKARYDTFDVTLGMVFRF